MKLMLAYGIFFIALVIILGLVWTYVHAGKLLYSKNSVESPDESNRVPTLFVPGFFGNRFSFGRLLSRLVNGFHANKSMVIVVKRDGSLKVIGALDKSRPLIQILFSKKTVRVKEQTTAIMKIINLLNSDYSINKVNLVGHSMGSISVIWSATNMGKQTHTVINKVVTIAGPFNDIEVATNARGIEQTELNADGPVSRSKVYQVLSETIKDLPTNTQILNIGGISDSKSNSDGAVSINSVRSLGFIVRQITKRYQELIITGKNASHRLLHENHQVDKSLAEFLWDS
ncbi:alpha/beta hydrolase [Lentilactobacillus sp. SPB1-3]|uniref:Alpha/beta hydrolase n=1 Tax=Lentilactobacillus terminaliae TaxID=3003483 RepID=A0ACD5DG92_9LACO|nr:alpha/beta hydrolase [Lentilactobacillus sp. SPB1-3]MCZ0976894.1 alpha/beta hydrolase [Lentilactobacillus sp. SPB1-3]